MPIGRGEIYVENLKDTQNLKEDAATLNELHNTIRPIAKEVRSAGFCQKAAQQRAWQDI
jgi:hypothetical protein